jgi:hypothetical protein
LSSDIDFESDLWLIEVTDDESASSSEFENDDYSLRSIPLFSNLYNSIFYKVSCETRSSRVVGPTMFYKFNTISISIFIPIPKDNPQNPW